jgi:hypothetical protein
VLRLSIRGLLAAALALAVIAPATASAATRPVALASATQGRLAVKVDITRFKATKSGTVAKGVATATLRGLGQLPTTVRKKVTLAAKKGGKCTILTLTLNQLNLQLLGLNVHLDKVVLTVTGQRHGGVLGSLFCSLAGAKVKLSRAAAAARINRQIRKTGTVRPLSFALPVQPLATASQAPVCHILDLVLGPLHLDLLGLVVDLNRVHLVITADPTGGILGSLFCGLANTTLP